MPIRSIPLPAVKPTQGFCPLLFKRCTRCKDIRPFSEFKWRRNRKYLANKPFKRPHCLKCTRATQKLRWQRMSGDDRQRRYAAHRKYMATPLGKVVGQKCDARWRGNSSNKRRMLNRMRERFLEKTYGISIEQYMEMFKSQRGLCAICQQSSLDRWLDVDHCHQTSKVRGLLCGRCNKAIGWLDDSPTKAVQAAIYLRKHR